MLHGRVVGDYASDEGATDEGASGHRAGWKIAHVKVQRRKKIEQEEKQNWNYGERGKL